MARILLLRVPFLDSHYHEFQSALASVTVLFALAAISLHFITSRIFLRYHLVNKNGDAIPPGPPIRYAFLRKCPERTLHSWAMKHRPLYSVWMGNQLFVVISDATTAQDLLVQQGAIFSSRKGYFIKDKIILKSTAITATPYNATWRLHRKIAVQWVSPKSVARFGNIIDTESRIFIRSLLKEGKWGQVLINPSLIAIRYSFNNILSISLGKRTTSLTDPMLKEIQEMISEFDDLTGPWSNAIDFINPLQYIPTRTRTRGKCLHRRLYQLYGGLISEMKQKLTSREEVPECIVKHLLTDQEEDNLTHDAICMLIIALAFGGVPSPPAIIQWFLIFMVSHPHVVHRAHEELDRVVGRNRLPDVDDEYKLPYIRAIIKEVQRLRPPFWIPTPHYTTEDFIYKGMFIPKDTVVVANLWTMHHDPRRYPNPFEFNPDRYLGDNHSCAESSRLSPDKRDHWAFGAGRRICVGMALAERQMWLAISRLLWCFDIRPAPGRPTAIEEYEDLSGRSALPFELRLIPRHTKVEAVLWEEAVEIY